MDFLVPFLTGLTIVVVWIALAFCLTFTHSGKMSWGERLNHTREVFFLVPFVLLILTLFCGFAFVVLTLIGGIAIELWKVVT